MINSRWSLVLLLMLLTGCNMSGCSLFNSEQFVDFRKDEQGHVILLDTPRRWRDWREAVNPQINAEIAGKSPPGVATWNQHWKLLLTELRENQENASKYIRYIVEKRHEAGLPEIDDW